MDKLRSERILLYREGFNPLLIRRWNYHDGTYIYEIRCNVRKNGDERWERINLPNEEVEGQIEKYGSQI